MNNLNCYKILKKHDIWSDNEKDLLSRFRKWTLKNHPDKGGNTSDFQEVTSCKLDFQDIKSVSPYLDIILKLEESNKELGDKLLACSNLGSQYYNETKILYSQLQDCKKLGHQYFLKTGELHKNLEIYRHNDFIKLDKCSDIKKEYLQKISLLEHQLKECKNLGKDLNKSFSSKKNETGIIFTIDENDINFAEKFEAKMKKVVGNYGCNNPLALIKEISQQFYSEHWYACILSHYVKINPNKKYSQLAMIRIFKDVILKQRIISFEETKFLTDLFLI